MQRPSVAGRGALVAVVAVATALSLTACGGNTPSAAPSVEASSVKLHVVASFYPLQFIVNRIGGDRVHVSNLTPAGAEPHDLELTADDTARLQDADLVVYLSGFSSAVDDAVDSVAGDHAFDVATFADLDLSYRQIDGGRQSGTSSTDPHFWLDPVRLANVADQVAGRMAELDRDDSGLYGANASSLRADLLALDNDFTAGLAHCANRTIVTTHNAFGYLADRYGMTQVGITGLTPEDEPSPQQLARATDFVEANNVHTIYFETLISPSIADTLAAETGAKTAVLDPLEGLSSTSAGSDYLEIMRANLGNLREGQPCA